MPDEVVPECDERGYDERDVEVEKGFVEGVADGFAGLQDYDDECYGANKAGDEHLGAGQVFAELLPAHWDLLAVLLESVRGLDGLLLFTSLIVWAKL